ncbi:hypothetical protein CK220_13135 [Mesorhizobium sp. WSM3860]|nr:hypothetical protein CK220_13135 [Mesorhizobium sp. WSM3860]
MQLFRWRMPGTRLTFCTAADGAAEVKAKPAQVDLTARFLTHSMETLYGDPYGNGIDHHSTGFVLVRVEHVSKRKQTGC